MDNLITKCAMELLSVVKKNNWKLQTIESMTGGSLINAITDIPSHSEYINGGLVIYGQKSKEEILGLDITEDFYSENFARKMVELAREKTNANIYISVTGNNSPDDIKTFGVFYVGLLIVNNGTSLLTSQKFNEYIKIEHTEIGKLFNSYHNETDADKKLKLNIEIRRAVKQRAVLEILYFVVETIKRNNR